MVKVVEAMPLEKFEVVLDAGAELFDQLRKVLRDYNLDADDAPAVLSVAAAAVMSVHPVNNKDFNEIVSSSAVMWRQTGSDLDSLEFDPPHRQVDVTVINDANN